jgi:hypothetical protein
MTKEDSVADLGKSLLAMSASVAGKELQLRFDRLRRE